MQFFFNDESFKKCRFWKKATCLCRNECFYSLARTDCSSRTPAGVTVMLKRGDASLFGKVTEWWNLTKRMRHIMDLGKHMNHLKHCHAVNIKSYQRWLRFIWGQFCFSCNPSNADEGSDYLWSWIIQTSSFGSQKGSAYWVICSGKIAEAVRDLKPKIW